MIPKRIAIQEIKCNCNNVCENGDKKPYPISAVDNENIIGDYCIECEKSAWVTNRTLPYNFMQFLKNVRLICVNYTNKCKGGKILKTTLVDGMTNENDMGDFCFSCTHVRVSNG